MRSLPIKYGRIVWGGLLSTVGVIGGGEYLWGVVIEALTGAGVGLEPFGRAIYNVWVGGFGLINEMFNRVEYIMVFLEEVKREGWGS